MSCSYNSCVISAGGIDILSLHLSLCLDMVLVQTFYQPPGNMGFMTELAQSGSGPSIGCTSVITQCCMF